MKTPTLTSEPTSTQQRAQAAFESIAAGLKKPTTTPVTFAEDDTSPQARSSRHYLGLAKQLKKGSK